MPLSIHVVLFRRNKNGTFLIPRHLTKERPQSTAHSALPRWPRDGATLKYHHRPNRAFIVVLVTCVYANGVPKACGCLPTNGITRARNPGKQCSREVRIRAFRSFIIIPTSGFFSALAFSDSIAADIVQPVKSTSHSTEDFKYVALSIIVIFGTRTN